MMRARLFRTSDVIAVTTGILIAQSRHREVDELVNYVLSDQESPDKQPCNKHDAANAVRSQLPSRLSNFKTEDLIHLIMRLKERRQQDELQSALVDILETTFGRDMPLCPKRYASQPSKSLERLRSLAENPETACIEE